MLNKMLNKIIKKNINKNIKYLIENKNQDIRKYYIDHKKNNNILKLRKEKNIKKIILNISKLSIIVTSSIILSLVMSRTLYEKILITEKEERNKE